MCHTWPVRYAALLRGVNIGNRRFKMGDLRELYTGMGFEDVATYLQSGNAVFSTTRLDREVMTHELEEAMASRFGFEVPALLVDAPHLRKVVERCPYVEFATADPTRVHVVFVDPTPFVGIDSKAFAPEEYSVGDGVVYVHLPDGMARSKLYDQLQRALVGVKATARNWRTTVSVLAMMDDQST